MKPIFKLFNKRSTKPDYMKILAKTCKEMPVVIRRVIEFEKLELVDVLHMESKRTFDVALLTKERIVIVRHLIGTTKAHIQEFDFSFWNQNIDLDQPNLKEFLRRYNAEVMELDRQMWTEVA